MTSSRLRHGLAAWVLVSAVACGRPEGAQSGATSRRPDSSALPNRAGPGSPAQPSAAAPSAPGDALRARDDLPPERRALIVVDGAERWVDALAIAAAGYTLIDLRDDWTPSIFAEERTLEGEPLPNRYRRVFLGLANDQLDSDGEALPPGEKNYLELYGIFPSLSVLRARFVQDAAHPCQDPESVSVLDAVETVTYVPPERVRHEAQRVAAVMAELEHARRKAKLASLQDLIAAQPQLAPKAAFVQKRKAEQAAMAAVEKRLTCEKMFPSDAKHTTGVYDEAMRLAVRRFQQKQMIYEANFLRRRTVDSLARPLLDNDYDALVRALRERVVAAAGLIEDGTGGTKKFPATNLVEQYTQVAVQQLGLTDAKAALAFFERHPTAHFRTLQAAVKLPPRPEYYSPNMDLSIVVDRGDVWYDLPFGPDGHFRQHGRERYPSLTLFVTYNGEKIPLARWRTTIGGWRAEQAQDGYEYFRYKGSDVGARVIRQVVSGPVWIAPESTPIRSLIKGKIVHGRRTAIVNYDELGPGYLSAYGLVAGYFVVPGPSGHPDWDNGIRAHGSSDYLSIYSSEGFSHGCHRLPNHIAIRLYSFILGHRNKQVAGDQLLNFSRQFLKGETVYEIRIPSRGYMYVLDPPLPVNVLEGRIKGAQKTPIQGYVQKPDTQYPPGPPPPVASGADTNAGGG
jgi:hypothetical protein